MKSVSAISIGCVAVLCASGLAAQDAPVPPVAAIEAEVAAVEAHVAAMAKAQAEVEHAVASTDRAVARALQMAQAAGGVPLPPPPPEADWEHDPMVLLGGRSPSARPMLVAGSKLEGGAVSELEEDLRVMSRILDKAVERPLGKRSLEQAMGIYVGSLGGGRGPQCLYLEGYGALFFLNVRFPLVAPSAKPETRDEKVEDSEWERTRREMRGERRSVIGDFAEGARVFAAEGPTMEYDAERVETLKTAVLEALRNAANIRHLKAGDTVTVAVSGTGGASGTRVRKAISNPDRPGARSTGSVEVQVVTTKDGPEPARRSPTLTISAKKSDIDALVQGKTDDNEFRKKVSVQVN